MGCAGGKAAATSDDKVKVVFVIGGPGSGKGTQCAKIKEDFKYEHLSTGDILRDIVKKQEHPKWEELDKLMKDGQLVSSALLVEFIKAFFAQYKGKKVLLDGFPRSNENIEEWEKQMKDVAELTGVLYFNCTPDEMKKRMLGRNEGRADDNEETMAKRIDVFEKDTMPLVERYRGKELVEIDAMKPKEEVFEEVKQKFTEKGL